MNQLATRHGLGNFGSLSDLMKNMKETQPLGSIARMIPKSAASRPVETSDDEEEDDEDSDSESDSSGDDSKSQVPQVKIAGRKRKSVATSKNGGAKRTKKNDMSAMFS